MRDVKELLQYKSTKRILLAAWILSTLAIFISVTLIVLTPTNAAPANNLSSKCTTTNESISVSDTTAIGRFTVPAGCPGTHVLLASYTAPNGTDGKPYTAQRLFASNRTKFGPGTHSLSVKLPNCYYQVDLARGTVLQNFANTTYTASPDHILLAAKHGGTQPCNQKPTPTPTPEPPQPIAPPAPTQTQQQSQTTVINASTPIKQSDEYTPPATTTLPETGASAGTVIASFFGITSLSSALYYAVTSRLFV